MVRSFHSVQIKVIYSFGRKTSSGLGKALPYSEFLANIRGRFIYINLHFLFRFYPEGMPVTGMQQPHFEESVFTK